MDSHFELLPWQREFLDRLRLQLEVDAEPVREQELGERELGERRVQVCHIACDDEGLFSYCGASDDEGSPPTCPDYEGEAICPGCGKPVCPSCAQLEDIETRAFGCP